MSKVQKALNKLYFALGEETANNAPSQMSVEVSASWVEYLSFLAMRSSGGAAQKRYFAMGAASARRSAIKPLGGKKSIAALPGKVLSRRGIKPVKLDKFGRVI